MVDKQETIQYLIDSNVIIDVLHGQAREIALLDELIPYGIAISIVAYGELFEGAYYNRDPLQALVELSAFMEHMPIVPMTSSVMERFGIIRGSLTRHVRTQIGDMDLLIAATAIVHDMTIVTRNLRHFSQIPGARLYEFGEELPRPVD